MTPKKAILSIPNKNIEIDSTFFSHFDGVYLGYLEGTPTVFKYSLKYASSTNIHREFAFLTKGLNKNISFLPKPFFLTERENYVILAKEHIPGITLSKLKASKRRQNLQLYDKFACEQDISSQILELYKHKLCSNDVAEHNIVYDSKTDKFSLFDYDQGIIDPPNSTLLRNKVIEELKELYYICDPKHFGNVEEYVSKKLNK